MGSIQLRERTNASLSTGQIKFVLMAILVFGGIFALLPAFAIALNKQLGWPVWDSLLLDSLGAMLIVLGVSAYAYCARLFAVRGEGTTSPLEPPKKLVAAGPYRYSRNPIYVGYVCFLVGEFLLFGHLALLLYAVAAAAVIQFLIVHWEEPQLLRRFGREYEEYCDAVPRWLRFWN